VDGPEILVASMSVPTKRGKSQAYWQYHSRSDRHSKVGCWGVLFDLLQQSRVMRQHVMGNRIVFGINHEMRDFATGRKKDLDLVIARPAGLMTKTKPRTFADLALRYDVVLTAAQQQSLNALPILHEGPVGAVLMALEAKAAMTAHGKAQPRLYDELNSSHLTVHGASRQALAVGLVMVNASTTFISPDMQEPGKPPVISTHPQPSAAAGIIDKVKEIPRRGGTRTEGFDGLAIVVVSMVNDGVTAVTLETARPAPAPGDIFHYTNAITRVANEYDTTFASI
jgi:hypothetical protein